MLTVRSTPASIERYHALLLSDWTGRFPEEVLALLWDSIEVRPQSAEAADLLKLLDPRSGEPFPTECFRSIVRRIGEGTRFVRLKSLPELPSDAPRAGRISKRAWLAGRLAAWLTLPAHVPLRGEVEFFTDVQGLAFQAAIHVVLPAVRERNPAEHAVLLHAAVLYAWGSATSDPAHSAYMMSTVHGYLGDDEQRLRSLHASFRFTPPRDHSYLTKAQEFWSELLDRGRHEEAERFLLSLHSWSLPEQQEEIREMVVDAFKHMLAERTASAT